MKLGDGLRLGTPNIREFRRGWRGWSESGDLPAAAWAGWVGALPQGMAGRGKGNVVRGPAEESGPGQAGAGRRCSARESQRAWPARLLNPVSPLMTNRQGRRRVGGCPGRISAAPGRALGASGPVPPRSCSFTPRAPLGRSRRPEQLTLGREGCCLPRGAGSLAFETGRGGTCPGPCQVSPSSCLTRVTLWCRGTPEGLGCAESRSEHLPGRWGGSRAGPLRGGRCSSEDGGGWRSP